MKQVNFYHTEFSTGIDTVIWEYTCLPENDRTKLAEIQFIATFDFLDIHNNYHFLVLTEKLQIDKYLKILIDNLILHFAHNITQKVLKDQIDLKKFEKTISKSNKVLWKNFRTKIEEWMLLNQDLDNVLDIINQKGIEKLRDIDKKFLENYGK